jgi:hypothetical protein
MSAESVVPGSLSSRNDFIGAARTLLLQLGPESSREVTLIDVDFSPWPLDDPAALDALTRWIHMPGRRLRLLGTRFDVIERDQPRFTAWRRPFSHAVEALSPTDLDPGDVPGLLWLESGCLELLDRERWQARWVTDRRALVLQRERIDALVQRCEAAWPVTTLGL